MFQITHIQHQKISNQIFLTHNLKPSSEDFLAKLQLNTLISNSSADSSKEIKSKVFNQLYFGIKGQTFASSITHLTKKVRYVQNETYQPSNSYFLELDSTVETNDRIRRTSLITNNLPERSNEIAEQIKISTILASWIKP